MLPSSRPARIVKNTANQSTIQQCCGSGMFIPDPDFYPSRISDPTTPPKRGWRMCCPTFFLGSHITKCKIISVLNRYRNYIIGTLYPKKSHYALKTRVQDPGTGTLDPGSRKNLSKIPESKRNRIPDPDPQHCHLREKREKKNQMRGPYPQPGDTGLVGRYGWSGRESQ